LLERKCDSLELSAAAGIKHDGRSTRNAARRRAFFYEFRLDEFMPSNHMLHAIDGLVDLSDLRRHPAPFYRSMVDRS